MSKYRSNQQPGDSLSQASYKDRIVEAYVNTEHTQLENMKTPIINVCESYTNGKDFELHIRRSFSTNQT